MQIDVKTIAGIAGTFLLTLLVFWSTGRQKEAAVEEALPEFNAARIQELEMSVSSYRSEFSKVNEDLEATIKALQSELASVNKSTSAKAQALEKKIREMERQIQILRRELSDARSFPNLTNPMLGGDE